MEQVRSDKIRVCILFSVLYFGMLSVSSYAAPLTCGDGICSSNESLQNCFSDCKKDPFMPTTLFGKVVDEAGNPVPNEILTAYWTDEFGNKQTAKTTSLSLQEARARGNEQLVGQFIFGEGTIKALPNTWIEIRSQPRYTSALVGSQPGRTKDAGRLQVFGIVEIRGYSPPLWPTAFPIDSILHGSIIVAEVIVLLAFAGFLLYRAYAMLRPRLNKKKGVMFWRTRFGSDLMSIMRPEIHMVQRTDSIDKLIGILKSKNTDVVLVAEGKYSMGYIDTASLVSLAIAKGGLPDITAGMVTIQNLVILDHRATISDVVSMVLKKKNLPFFIAENKEMKGSIGFQELGNALKNELKSLANKKTQTTVTQLMRPVAVRDSAEENLLTICKSMEKSKTDIALLYEQNVAEKTIRDVGIITTSSILDALYKDHNSLARLKAKHVMSSPIISIAPSVLITTANEVMVEKKCVRLPVLKDNKIVGIVYQEDIVRSLFENGTQ